MLPRKKFENLHAVMAILVVFEYFSRKLWLNFLTLILSTSPNMIHFVRIFLVMRAQDVKLIAIEEVRNYRRIVCIKNIFENGWWEDAYPSFFPSGFVPGHKLEKPSKESGIYQFFDTISRLLFLFTKRQSQKGRGAWHNGPAPKYAL